MDKSLTSRSDDSIKEITNFPFNEISDIFLVNRYVIFNNLCQNHAKGTFILKSPCETFLFVIISSFEICICTGCCHLLHSDIYFLKIINPLRIFGEFLNLWKQFFAGIRRRWQEDRLFDRQFFIKGLHLHKYFHGNGKCMACLFFSMGFRKCLEMRIKGRE